MPTCFESVWQDREIRFDAKLDDLEMRRGEKMIDSINSVEDTKGNNGERGSFFVSNLRLVWTSHKRSRTNLSIGFATILSISIKKTKSKLRGVSQALHLMCRHDSHRFEFVFTSLVQNSPRLFTTAQSVLRAYETTKLYRDLKLRISLVRNGALSTLPREKIFSETNGVWNLSSEQGNLGKMFVTNIRIVWHANLAQNFNVSVPYTQINSEVSIRSSKFGPALVVESCGYVLGFKMDPPEKLDALKKEISSLHSLFRENPIFGVEFESEEVQEDVPRFKRTEDDCHILEDEQGDQMILMASHPQTDEIVFDSTYLGLCVQKTSADLQQLWTTV